MATRIYAKLNEDRIKQLDAECEKRDIYRPEFVTEAVELYLDTEGDPKQKLDALKQEQSSLRESRDAAVKQRDKFKEKFENAVQTNEVLIAKIRDLQSQGIFARASGVKRINTDTYDISGGSK